MILTRWVWTLFGFMVSAFGFCFCLFAFLDCLSVTKLLPVTATTIRIIHIEPVCWKPNLLPRLLALNYITCYIPVCPHLTITCLICYKDFYLIMFTICFLVLHPDYLATDGTSKPNPCPRSYLTPGAASGPASIGDPLTDPEYLHVCDWTLWLTSTQTIHPASVPVPELTWLSSSEPFHSQCFLIFELQLSSFPHECSREAYFITLLSTRAWEWGAAVWELECDSFTLFAFAMKTVFNHSASGPAAIHQLFWICQDCRSVSDYTTEFRTLAASAGWDDIVSWSPGTTRKILHSMWWSHPLFHWFWADLAITPQPASGLGLRNHHRLEPRLPQFPSTLATKETPPYLPSVSADYHCDISQVFSKSQACSLTPHRSYDCTIELHQSYDCTIELHQSYDCTIELLPGIASSRGCLFLLSAPETQAMEKYISESLSAGLIHPSSTSAGAGFFFVENNKSLRPCI